MAFDANVPLAANQIAADLIAINANWELVARNGANTDITSLGGLTTPLSKAQGGSGTTGDSIVKAWIQFNGTGTVAIADSFNVSGIVDNGTGNYTVTIDTDFANANFAITVSSSKEEHAISSLAVGSFVIATSGSAGTLADANPVCAIVIGDQ